MKSGLIFKPVVEEAVEDDDDNGTGIGVGLVPAVVALNDDDDL